MGLWDGIRNEMDPRIRAMGAQNAYFPLLFPVSLLSKEANHVDGFSKECAVITHHRLHQPVPGQPLQPDPSAELAEPLVVRPTSEAVIWESFREWIATHRDLPVKVNQWANVVRWELRTRPFLRTSEFLWQEGHTAHATPGEATKQTVDAITMYADFAKEVLALPTVVGEKTPRERFAGAAATLTIEAMMQNGWALQSGTSHDLADKFSEAFNVRFADEEQSMQRVWASSWGVSTRLIGAVVMSHSDDTGLVLPPAIAPEQVVVLPLLRKNKPSGPALEAAEALAAALQAQGIRAVVDSDMARGERLGGLRFRWERRGVPLRIELGGKEVEAGLATMRPRVGLDAGPLELALGADQEELARVVRSALGNVQSRLLELAGQRLGARTRVLRTLDEVVAHCGGSSRVAGQEDEENDGSADEQLRAGAECGFAIVPWREDTAMEERLQEETKLTIRCYPRADLANPNLEQMMGGVTEADLLASPCFFSGRPADRVAVIARAY